MAAHADRAPIIGFAATATPEAAFGFCRDILGLWLVDLSRFAPGP